MDVKTATILREKDMARARYRVDLLEDPERRKAYQQRVAELAPDVDTEDHPEKLYQICIDVIKTAAEDTLGTVTGKGRPGISRQAKDMAKAGGSNIVCY